MVTRAIRKPAPSASDNSWLPRQAASRTAMLSRLRVHQPEPQGRQCGSAGPALVGAAGQARGNGTRSEAAATGACSAAACSPPPRRTMAPLRTIVSTSSAARTSGRPAQQPGRVGQPRPGVQVGLDLVSGDPVADHQGEGEDPPGAVPDRPGRVVDQALGATQGGGERGPRGRPGSARGRAAAHGGSGRPAGARRSAPSPSLRGRHRSSTSAWGVGGGREVRGGRGGPRRCVSSRSSR